MSITESTSRPLRGWSRMRQLRQQEQAQREALAADLLAGLGRPATAFDKVAIGNLASLHVRANRLEANGRDSSDIRRLITRTMRAFGMTLGAPAAPPVSIEAALKARGHRPPEP
jgi:hypothetical protein